MDRIVMWESEAFEVLWVGGIKAGYCATEKGTSKSVYFLNRMDAIKYIQEQQMLTGKQ